MYYAKVKKLAVLLVLLVEKKPNRNSKNIWLLNQISKSFKFCKKKKIYNYMLLVIAINRYSIDYT